MTDLIYQVDKERLELPETGIYVRAKTTDGDWASVDVAHLDEASMTHWLRSRGGDNPLAESVVKILMGYPVLLDVEVLP